MNKETCTVCGREIDSRGMSGHMKSHKAKAEDKVLYGHDGQGSGVISYPSGDKTTGATGGSYPSNEQETDVKQDVVPGSGASHTGRPVKPGVNTETPDNVKQPKKKKAAKKTVVSKPASRPASSPDTRGQRNSGSKSTGHPKDSGVTEAEHKTEWQGLFRD